MEDVFSLSDFRKQFPTNEACLEEIKKLKFPKGILCSKCEKNTKFYKIRGRMAYSCELCRKQIYPLTDTIFEKTTTPLQKWFYCMYIMTQTRGTISSRALSKELGVTYKTAWRMAYLVRNLMKQNNADLLSEAEEVITWTLFGTFEFRVVRKQQTS